MTRIHALVVSSLAAWTALITAGAALGDPAPHAHEHEHSLHPETEQIIVTATPLEHTRDELALPVNRLSRQDVLDRAAITIGETTDRVPGLATTGFTTGASRPVIRGQNAYRTGVLEDSLPTQGVSQLSPDHAVPANPLAAEAIEVVRGPATLRYGGGAVAGAVNVLTGRIPMKRPDAPISLDTFGAYGSNSNTGLAAVVAEGIQGNIGWHVDGVYQHSEDYKTGSGVRQEGTHAKGGAGAAGATWFGESTRIGGSYTHFNSDYGIPEEGEPVEIDMNTNRYRLEAEADAPLPGIHTMRASGVYSDYEHKEIADGEVGQTFDNDQFDARIELLHDPISGFDGALGFTGQYRDFSAGGEAAEFLAPTKSWQFAVYAFEERQLTSTIETQFGLRIEGAGVHGTPITGDKKCRHFVPVSGSIGLLARPVSDMTFGLTWSASQRAPSDVELFARGPHEATGTFEIGSPSLDVETGYSGELRYQLDRGRIQFDGAAFVTYFDDYIFGNLTGVTVDEEGDPVPPGTDDALDQLEYISRNALFYGGELSLKLDLFEVAGGSVKLDGQFDWVRARFTDVSGAVNRNVPRIPPIRWGGGVSFEASQLTARIGFYRSQRQQHPGQFETATRAYTFLDLDVRWNLATLANGADLDLMFTGRNLTNAAARNPIAINKDEVELPGRWVRVGLRARF